MFTNAAELFHCVLTFPFKMQRMIHPNAQSREFRFYNEIRPRFLVLRRSNEARPIVRCFTVHQLIWHLISQLLSNVEAFHELKHEESLQELFKYRRVGYLSCYNSAIWWSEAGIDYLLCFAFILSNLCYPIKFVCKTSFYWLMKKRLKCDKAELYDDLPI